MVGKKVDSFCRDSVLCLVGKARLSMRWTSATGREKIYFEEVRKMMYSTKPGTRYRRVFSTCMRDAARKTIILTKIRRGMTISRLYDGSDKPGWERDVYISGMVNAEESLRRMRTDQGGRNRNVANGYECLRKRAFSCTSSASKKRGTGSTYYAEESAFGISLPYEW